MIYSKSKFIILQIVGLFTLLNFKFCLAESPLSVQANSKITEVTVYDDRARVNRSTRLSLPAGESVVVFTGLPLNIEESSVAVSGSGSEKIKILGLEIRNEFLEQAASDSVEKLQNEIQSMEDQIAVLDDKISDLGERKEFLQKIRDSIGESGEDTASKNAPGETQLRSLYTFYTDELQAISDQLRTIGITKRGMAPRLEKLRSELARINSGANKQTKSVRVAVQSPNPSEATLQMSYVLPGASWHTAYHARANTDKSEVELTTYGIVRQTTGEDWQEVILHLSTAQPRLDAHMQELQPQWVNFREFIALPKPAPQAPLGASGKEQVFRKRSQTAETSDYKDGEEREIQQETAHANIQGLSTIFDIKLPATIASDREPHKNVISIRNYQGHLDYITTPKLAENAYLRARLTNHTEIPLLPGEISLFRDGDFTGSSALPFIAAGAPFDFYLGMDDRIKIMRKILVDRLGEGGLISKKKTLSKKFEIQIENFLPASRFITILDQIPVTKNTAITLSDVKYSPQPKSTDANSGKMQWEMLLQPNKKETLTLEYSLEWPSDKEIMGF